VLSGVPSADVRYGDGVLTIRGMASPPGLSLAGEIAETHFAPLVRALDDFSTSREVHLDLSGLDYCDVACLPPTRPQHGQRQPGIVTGTSGRDLRRPSPHPAFPDFPCRHYAGCPGTSTKSPCVRSSHHTVLPHSDG
jgi:hypothetical protein